MHPPHLYVAAGLRPRVEIADDGTLVRTLGAVMQGWAVLDAGAESGGPGPAPAIRVRLNDRGWTFLDAGGAEEIAFGDPVAAACKVIADLYKAATLVEPEELCLHAAGVRVGGGLVLLTGHYRAGKSVVTAACAAAGLQVFSDDIIPLAAGSGVARAPGLAIRLRLPLPSTLAPETRAFLSDHEVAAGSRYLYVRPPRDRLAEQGEQAALRAIVSLRRAEGEAARLRPLAPADALAEIIRRNFARGAPAGRILDAFDRLVDGLAAYRLVYDDADEAAALLGRAFGQGAPAALESPEPEAEREAGPEGPAPKGPAPKGPAPKGPAPKGPDRPLPAATLISRARDVRVRERDGQAFLTDGRDALILNLNATGAAVWRLLDGPATLADLVEVFAAAFPESAPEVLAADLSRLIRSLAASGVVRFRDAG